MKCRFGRVSKELFQCTELEIRKARGSPQLFRWLAPNLYHANCKIFCGWNSVFATAKGSGRTNGNEVEGKVDAHGKVPAVVD